MRPIDADELPKQEIKDEKEYINPSYARGWNDAIRSVYLYAPTIEAEPVRRGRDIYQQVKGHCEFKCSLCGVELGEVRGGELDYGLDGGYFKYCPNCGARMEGQE